MAFYISEREFQGEKTLSVVRFTSADEKTEVADRSRLWRSISLEKKE